MKTPGFPLAALVLLAPCAALAQAPIDQNRIDRSVPGVKQGAPSGAARPGKTAPTAIPDSLRGAGPLRAVVVDGASLSPGLFALAEQGLIGKPLDRATLQAAADAAAAVYARSDIALYTIQAPAQSLADGVLHLRATEGFVAGVKVSGRDAAGVRLARKYAEALKAEKPLRRSHVERALSLISDIPGVTATPAFLRGAAPGAVILSLDVKAKRTDYDLSLTNRGDSTLGGVQVQANYTLNGVFRDGDSTRLSVAAPPDLTRFQFYGLSHSEPLGSDGLRLMGSIGYLRTHPGGLLADGHATTASLQLSYPVIRSYKVNLYAVAALDSLDSSNAVINQLPATERTRALRGSLAWSDAEPRSVMQASAVASFGETEGGGFAVAGGADERYRKLNARFAIDHALGTRWVARAKAMVQLSPDRLPASELLSLGGDDFGRAYAQSSAIGDQGGAAAVELAYRPAGLPKALQGSEVYGFMDTGETRLSPRFGGPETRTDLSSAGLGIRVAWKVKTVIGVEAAYGLNPPQPQGDRAWRLGFTLLVRP